MERCIGDLIQSRLFEEFGSRSGDKIIISKIGFRAIHEGSNKDEVRVLQKLFKIKWSMPVQFKDTLVETWYRQNWWDTRKFRMDWKEFFCFQVGVFPFIWALHRRKGSQLAEMKRKVEDIQFFFTPPNPFWWESWQGSSRRIPHCNQKKYIVAIPGNIVLYKTFSCTRIKYYIFFLSVAHFGSSIFAPDVHSSSWGKIFCSSGALFFAAPLWRKTLAVAMSNGERGHRYASCGPSVIKVRKLCHRRLPRPTPRLLLRHRWSNYVVPAPSAAPVLVFRVSWEEVMHPDGRGGAERFQPTACRKTSSLDTKKNWWISPNNIWTKCTDETPIRLQRKHSQNCTVLHRESGRRGDLHRFFSGSIRNGIRRLLHPAHHGGSGTIPGGCS